MGLFHLDDVLDAPRCYGNCRQGRARCTMPGSCHTQRNIQRNTQRTAAPKRIRPRWTCCNQCHREHRWLTTARLHRLWLRLIARLG